jgi:hypothetical protein
VRVRQRFAVPGSTDPGWVQTREWGALMLVRLATRLAAAVVAFSAVVGVSVAQAQQLDCRYFKVTSDKLNAFYEPRSDAKFVGALDRNDIVCVAGDQEVAGRVWVFIPFQVEPRKERKPIQGWALKDSLTPASQEEVTALSESKGLAPEPHVAIAPPPTEPPHMSAPAMAPAEPPHAAPPPTAGKTAEQEVVRYSQPIPFGGYPVQGKSLEELVHGVPTFPPIEGLPDDVWHKTCSNCHNWNQQTLCQQAMIYAQDVKMTMRKQHPYGGPEKLAMRNWAQHGCQ